MNNPHEITKVFEQSIADYTGAPYVIAVDNQSNALYISLMWYKHLHNSADFEITIPSHTYPSVPCEIIRAGFKVKFKPSPKILTGEYLLEGTNIYDSALKFTDGMYRKGMIQCLSFTGPYKHLKLTKGGAILTDNKQAYEWLKKMRFSGRSECSYHIDNFDNNPVIGMNCYMIPEIAARGIQMMAQFYDVNGKPISNDDKRLPYPDLSKFKLWQ